MDGSNNPNDGPSRGQDHQQPGQKRELVYVEKMRQRVNEVQEKRHILEQMAEPYNEYAKRAIASAYPDTHGMFYNIMGINANATRMGASRFLAEMSGLNGRELEQPVVNAVAETYRSVNRTAAVCEWGIFIGITAIVFRKWRSKLSYKLIGWQRYSYPATRLAGYMFLGYGFVSPTLSSLSKLVHAKRMSNDSRMQGIKLSLDHDPTMPPGAPARKSYRNEDRRPSTSYDDASSTGSWQAESNPPIQEQATAWRGTDTEAQNSRTWDRGSSSQGNSSWSQSSEPAPIQTNSAWDSTDPIDDASPLAPPSSARSASNTGESSWDRLRRQAGVQSRPTQRPPQARQPPLSQGGWGENTDTSSQFGGSSRGSRDDDSWSSADREKAAEKDQAQQEFDRMLAQERKGVEQDNKRWR